MSRRSGNFVPLFGLFGGSHSPRADGDLSLAVLHVLGIRFHRFSRAAMAHCSFAKLFLGESHIIVGVDQTEMWSAVGCDRVRHGYKEPKLFLLDQIIQTSFFQYTSR